MENLYSTCIYNRVRVTNFVLGLKIVAILCDYILIINITIFLYLNTEVKYVLDSPVLCCCYTFDLYV